MVLGMRGTPPGTADIAIVITLGILMQIIYSFIVGSILGAIYSLWMNNKKKRWQLVAILVAFIVCVVMAIYNNQ